MSEPQYLVRLATVEDVPKLRAIELDAARRFEEYPELLAGSDDTVDPDVLVEAVSEQALLVATELPGGQVVGFALIEIDEHDSEAYLHELSVAMEHQGRGVGTLLLEAVVDSASTKQLNAVTLSTFIDVEWNGPFYAKRGFTALEKEQFTRRHHMLRAEEAGAGLNVHRRTFMVRNLTTAAEA